MLKKKFENENGVEISSRELLEGNLKLHLNVQKSWNLLT